MAVYSMTGFASAHATPPAHTQDSTSSRAGVTVELRSVNGRFLDLSLRLPDELRSLEPALREIVAAAVRRGKIELRVVTHRDADAGPPTPAPEQLSRLARLESTVQTWLPAARALSVAEVLQWSRGAGVDEDMQTCTLQAARDGTAGLREARAREGDRLAAVLLERVQRLRALAAQAAPLVPALVQRQQQRFIERFNEALAAAGAADTESPRERALGEAAAYALRIDVAEELGRLGAHLDEIERLLKVGGEIGKRLDFLIQELHREANTLGSKSATLELTTIAVDMKVLIEQLREQVQNIE
ncbi:MAG: YicC family protein [Burkholderiaceae bacterium]|nr:YicC family protein [Ideonella sp.]MCC7284691.1 YicC family protein [Burkholderiaceae bacterium]